MKKSRYEYPVPEIQADAYLSQANPVSGTKYIVLDTTKNVRVISICAWLTWATTQPTPLEVHVTIDGQVWTFSVTDPVSNSAYKANISASGSESNQVLDAGTALSHNLCLLEGRSVKVEVEITWAVTQPTPLVCRVKYAKW